MKLLTCRFSRHTPYDAFLLYSPVHIYSNSSKYASRNSNSFACSNHKNHFALSV